MDWVHEYVPGQVRASCSVCGCSRRFPDNLTYCVDKLFRCERCMETTALELDQRIQSYRMQPDDPDVSIGLIPQADVASTFLADSIEARSLAIPGWTPSTTLSDDFSTLPGAVGSSWSTALTGTGAITALTGGGARFSAGTGSAIAYVPTMSVPLPSAGRFYARFRFAAATPGGNVRLGASSTVAGSPSGTAHSVLPVLTTFINIWPNIGNSVYFTNPRVYIESSTTWHVAEMWWKGDGYVRFLFDGAVPFVQSPLASQVLSSAVPFISATVSALSVLDVSNFVAFT